MTHIEPVEPRCLLAAEVLDTTFGVQGHAALPARTQVNATLATRGGIYVDAYNYRRERRLIYKYTDAGTIDTSWGSGGYVAVNAIPSKDVTVTSSNPLTLVYDARTGGLLVGVANNGTINLQRFTADGTADESWGTHGIVSYSEKHAKLTIGALTPLASKKLLVSFQSFQQLAKATDGTARPGGEVDVTLLRLDHHGRYDKTFAGDGTVTAAHGSYQEQTPSTTNPSGFNPLKADIPTYGDVQLRADGGYRVISTREQTTSISDIDGGFDTSMFDTKTGRTVISAESTVISATGIVQGKRSQTYVLRRDSYKDVSPSVTAYQPKLVIAEGNTGLAVLATNSTNEASLLRVSPEYRTVTASLFADDTFVSGAYRNPNGNTIVETNGIGFPAITRFNRDLTPSTVFGSSTFTGSTAYIGLTPDDAGRVIVVYRSQELRRLL